MSSSSIFWRSVEAIGGGARDAALRAYFGETYDQVSPYLMPCAELATHVACPRTLQGDGCQYRIVQESEPDGTYAAVCDRHYCPTKFYARAELVRYTINPQLLIRAIARCLGLHPQIACVMVDVWQVGQISTTAGSSAVLFTRCKFSDAMQRIIESLILKSQKGFVLVTPTIRYLTSPSMGLLQRVGSIAFPLDDATEINGHHPVLTEAGRVRWQKSKEAIGGASVLGATFPTPAGAQWHDLSITFRDGHTITASVGSIKGSYTFQDMGMANRKTLSPDEQWQLLYHFAEEAGIFTWKSRYADQRNKKRKGRLAARLKAFFGIPGDPFAYRRADGGWQTVFSIRVG